MKSSYEKLGKYIRPVEIRNRNLEIDNLIGLSIQKKFIPSISNTIGTDMSTYRILNTEQFAYCPVTSRNGEKITVALYQEKETAIISQAYDIFEITDKNELLPEYLMMWFRRPEFDRYARFMSHGSVRELLGWEELCEVELPIPSPDKQRELVKEYNTILQRIDLNNQLIQKLEETAQAIYKQWFVDSEFPNENGEPYKSAGGEMVESELGDIPKGWRVESYKVVADFKTGRLNSNAAVENGTYPFFTCSTETFKTNTYSFDTEAVILAGNNASAIYPLKYFVGKFDAYQRTYIVTSKCETVSNKQIYFSLMAELENFKGISSGTATKFLTMGILNNLQIVVPDKNTFQKFDKFIGVLFAKLQIFKKEHGLVSELRDTILSKLATVRD